MTSSEQQRNDQKEKIVLVGLSAVQLHLYKGILQRDLDLIDDAESSLSVLKGSVMQLLQCCNHPYLFEGVAEEQQQKERSFALHPENVTIHHLIKNCGKLFIMDLLITKLLSSNSNETDSNSKDGIMVCVEMEGMVEWLRMYCNLRGLSHHIITDDQVMEEQFEVILYQINSSKSATLNVKDGIYSNIKSVIFYDTKWTTKCVENAIRDTLSALNVYRLITKDTLEERVVMMDGAESLDRDEIVSLLQHKANTILGIKSAATMELDADIESILESNAEINPIDDFEDGEEDGIQIERKFTMRDIINHPENQGVIRVFVVVFSAVIVIPLIVVYVLHHYVLPFYLLDWSKNGKENLLVLVGVGVAHLIGILYTCYAWSGEDRVPAHILDAEEEEEEGDSLSEQEEDQTERDSSGSCNTNTLHKKSDQLMADNTERDNTTAVDARSGRNQLRRRRVNASDIKN